MDGPQVPKENIPDFRSRTIRHKLARVYGLALLDYIEHRSLKRLRSAWRLGGLAQRSGLSVFDLACLHGRILDKAVNQAARSGKPGPSLGPAEDFLLEALSPFEAARRGLPAAYERLARLEGRLDQRNRAMALIAAQQHETEGALRDSRQLCTELSQQAGSMQADIRRHGAKLVMVIEEERKRVSRELHDEVGQALAAANVGLVLLKKQAGADRAMQKRIADTQLLLEQSMEAVHRFARGLRPEILDIFGPYEAIRAHVRAFAARTGIEACIQPAADLAGLSDEQEIVLFRVAQESITNIAKHAQATRIAVRFFRSAEDLGMEIWNNGLPFPAEEKLVKNGAGRLGLLGMRERVQLVNGTFAIQSQPGSGTSVRVQLPLGPERSTVLRHPAVLNGNHPPPPTEAHGVVDWGQSIL